MATVEFKNRFPDIRLKLSDAAGEIIKQVAVDVAARAKELCPVSDNNDPGHVHLRDTIGTVRVNQYRTDVVATAPYAGFVEFGTTKMAPQPFVSPAFEEVTTQLERKAADLMEEQLK